MNLKNHIKWIAQFLVVSTVTGYTSLYVSTFLALEYAADPAIMSNLVVPIAVGGWAIAAYVVTRNTVWNISERLSKGDNDE